MSVDPTLFFERNCRQTFREWLNFRVFTRAKIRPRRRDGFFISNGPSECWAGARGYRRPQPLKTKNGKRKNYAPASLPAFGFKSSVFQSLNPAQSGISSLFVTQRFYRVYTRCLVSRINPKRNSDQRTNNQPDYRPVKRKCSLHVQRKRG